tara:strand:+ start:773 stop:1828 length:1056 start_codon:yes stop_codon:yes gene_type:complete
VESKILIKDFDEIILQKINLKKLANKHILIAGANGFIGSYILCFFLYLNETKNLNITIHALVRDKKKLNHLLESNKKNNNLNIYQNDIAKSKPKISHSIDYIFHLASKASPQEYISNPLDIIESNLFGTFNLTKIALEKNCKKFIYFSSGEVYGSPVSKNQEFSEESFGTVDPLKLRSSNTESKRMAENIILSISEKENLNFNIIRPFHTYGPGMSLESGLIHNELISNILSNENLILKSNGLAKRNFCYISDFLAGFLKVLIHGEKNCAYNIANPNEEIAIKSLAKKLIHLSKNKNLKVVYKIDNKNNKRNNNISRSIPSIGKIKKLKWEPKIDLDDGLKRTIEYYKELE